MGRHLIHSQTLYLRYSNATRAKMDMDQWGVWYQHELLSVIAEVLDELEIPGKTIRLDKLELDLGRISGKPDPDILRKKLREALKDQIQRQFPELIRIHPVSLSESLVHTRMQDEQKDLEQLIYLLEKGRQPWWALSSKKARIRHLFQKLFRVEKNSSLKKWLESQPLSSPASQRLANHLAYSDLVELAIWVFPENTRAWKLVSKSLAEALTREAFEKAELEVLLSEVLVETFFVEKSGRTSIISEWFKSNILFSPNTKSKPGDIAHPYSEPAYRTRTGESLRINKKLQKEIAKLLREKGSSRGVSEPPYLQARPPAGNIEKDETYPISNAGLVLAAPFLPYFFKGLGLVEKKEFVSRDAQNRALLLIQALLDESYAYEESDLLLNKILCGITPDEPIPVTFSPTDLEKEELPNLLDAMVQQWTALKSNSGRSMARGFFPREGSLRRTDKGYQLTIPRTSIDILLNRLPWTISIIKLSWMDETLFVEW